MKNFKNIFIGGLLIIMFLLGKECGNKKSIEYLTKTETIHDTIWPDTTKIEVPKPYGIHDTAYFEVPVPIPLDSFKLAEFFKKRFYKNDYRDSSGVYTAEDTVIGYLLYQKLYYRSFKPLSISNSTITSIIPKDSLKTSKNRQINLGSDITLKNIFFNLEYQNNRNIYRVGYDPFHKIPNTNIGEFKVGYSRVITRW